MIDAEKAINENGEDWIVAALVYGSIGYYSPHSAKTHLDRLRRREADCNERLDACFEGDSSKELDMTRETSLAGKRCTLTKRLH